MNAQTLINTNKKHVRVGNCIPLRSICIPIPMLNPRSKYRVIITASFILSIRTSANTSKLNDKVESKPRKHYPSNTQKKT
jgi:hypothetical protein